MKRSTITFAVAAVALTSMLAAAALASAVVAKPSLTVRVTGQGRVTSRPGGIACPSKCHVGFRRGVSVHLVAHPASGWELAGWSGACKGAGSCAVKLTASKTVRVAFTQMIPVTQPPPIPTARPGHYTGTNSLGKPLTFDVSADGTTVTGFVTNADVNCTEIQGFTLNEPFDLSTVAFPVKPDLTFGDSASETFPDGSSVSLSVSGQLSATAGATGTLRFDIAIPDLPNAGDTLHCSTGDVTWTAATS